MLRRNMDCGDYYRGDRDYSCDEYSRGCYPRCNCSHRCRCLPGKSAYEIALDNGFVGTEVEWLESLKGESGPFLSSYIEAVGTAQTVANNQGFVFDTDPIEIDIVGGDIEVDSSGSVFTIRRTGLYRVEWSMNVSASSDPVVVGLMENGEPASGMSNHAVTGNYSSGALINVEEGDLPYTVVLHNFGAPISIANLAVAGNTAVSIRISRFADTPSA